MKINYDKEQVLAGHFLLKHLDRAQLKDLAASTVHNEYAKSAVIFQKGDPGDSVMAVVAGKVKICTHSSDGKELVLNIINRGGLFGEIALLDGEPRSADAIALERTDLLVLQRTHFIPFLTRNPGISTQIIALLCQRLRQTSATLEDTMFLEAQARLARALLRLSEVFGKPDGSGKRLDIKLNQTQLGNLVGVSRESVNKHLGEWTKDGFIVVNSGYITIKDIDALEDISTTPAT